jgi:hypothetical protein
LIFQFVKVELFESGVVPGKLQRAYLLILGAGGTKYRLDVDFRRLESKNPLAIAGKGAN